MTKTYTWFIIDVNYKCSTATFSPSKQQKMFFWLTLLSCLTYSKRKHYEKIFFIGCESTKQKKCHYSPSSWLCNLRCQILFVCSYDSQHTKIIFLIKIKRQWMWMNVNNRLYFVLLTVYCWFFLSYQGIYCSHSVYEELFSTVNLPHIEILLKYFFIVRQSMWIFLTLNISYFSGMTCFGHVKVKLTQF